MKGEAPTLMIGIGGPGKGGGDYESEKSDAEPPSSPGELAAAAFCKAKDRGDYAGVWEAFQEMLAVADDEMGEDLPPEAMADMPIM